MSTSDSYYQTGYTEQSSSGANWRISLPCPYCSMHHKGVCEKVKAMEYYRDGRIKRVEFKTPSDYMAPVILPKIDWEPPTIT